MAPRKCHARCKDISTQLFCLPVLVIGAALDTLFCEGKAPHPLRRGEEVDDDEAHRDEESELAHRAAACARGRAVSTYAVVGRDLGRLGVSKRVEREAGGAGKGMLREKFSGEKRGSGAGRTGNKELAAGWQYERLKTSAT